MVKENCVEFEETLKKCGFGKFNYILIALAGGLMTCAYIELTSISFILPLVQCDFNLSTSDKGILGAIGYFGVILSSHFWGFLSDTSGRRKTMIVSLLLASLTSFVSSFAYDFRVLVSLRFFNGFL